MDKREFVITEAGEVVPVATPRETAELIFGTAGKIFRECAEQLEAEAGSHRGKE